MKELQGKVAHMHLSHLRDRKKPMWLEAVTRGRQGEPEMREEMEPEKGSVAYGRPDQSSEQVGFKVPTLMESLSPTRSRKRETQMPKRVRMSPEG